MSSCRLHVCLRALLCGLLLLIAASGLQAEPLRDPTRPPQSLTVPARVETTSKWQVSSILISADRRVAMVNGRAVQVGDRVSGARVLAIAADSVRLRNEKKEFTVRLHTQRIKEPVAETGEKGEGK